MTRSLSSSSAAAASASASSSSSILLLVLLALLSSISCVTADSNKKKECIKLSRGKELKEQLASGNNVLLVLGNDDDEATYKELCSRLEQTPTDRVKDFDIAFVKDSNMRRNVMAKAEPPKLNILAMVEKKVVDLVTGTPPPNLEVNFPEYVLYTKDNAETGIRFLKDSVAAAGGGDNDNDEKDDNSKAMADAVSDFISTQLHTKKIGSFVYALGSYDMVAAQIMKYDTGSWQQRFWAEGVSKILQTMFLKYPIAKWTGQTTPVMEFEMELINNYIKIGNKVVQEGKLYPENQVKRLEDMLENDKNSIGEMKKESMSQRVYTLKRFSEPETFGDKEIMSFLVKIGMNLFTLLLMLVMIPMMFLSSPEDEDEEGEGKSDDKEESDEKETAGAETEEKKEK
ncbi:unnamed protein product [Cylindrotheca closterium]|uniref:Uncharacterized protein n=1 Tax=Cylindrotheca closterium TaxID=2856 RepID=A0AAD2CM48_9STRA|nr:unnamed protein product [Cylindrotheca closterium]